MMRWATLLCVGIVALGGCASIDDYHYSLVNHRRADIAWQKYYAWHERSDLSAHYSHGWKKGYFEVCTGGSGEPPAVPPSKYWSPRYQGEHGQTAIEDWYAGYQEGATAAQSTGVGEWHPIYTGPTVPMTPVGWPAVEMFPPQTFPAEPAAPQPTKPVTTGEPQRLAPTAPVQPWSARPELTQELAPQELEAFPLFDASRRLPPPTDEANVTPPAEETNAAPPTKVAPAVPPTKETPAARPTDETDLAPPVFTDE